MMGIVLSSSTQGLLSIDKRRVVIYIQVLVTSYYFPIISLQGYDIVLYFFRSVPPVYMIKAVGGTYHISLLRHF